MSLIKATARADFKGTGDFFLKFRSKLVAAVDRSLQIAADEARALVPVDTGELRNSIHVVPATDDGEMATGYVEATAPHAGYVEFGTGQRGAESPGSDLRHRYKMDWRGMPAQPYLRPALDTARKRILQEFSR